MNKHSRIIFGYLCINLLVAGGVNAYTPPIGIPDPSWGTIHPIDTVAPSHPAGWPKNEVDNYYYIDNTHPNATNSQNRNGYPDKPRLTFPNVRNFDQGSVIEIHGGPYTTLSRPRLSFNCTEIAPCWLRGSSITKKPTIVNKLEIQDSSYLFVENIRFEGGTNSAILLLAHNRKISHHISFRNIEVINRSYVSSTGAIIIYPLNGGKINDVVVHNAFMEKLGTNVNWFDPKTDPDFLGVSISVFGRDVSMGTELSRVWVLDSLFRKISSNAVQVVGQNCRKGSCFDMIHHIFIGRNIAHSNRQSGFWSKQARDVVFSENVTYDNRRHGKQPGDGIGFQYGPDRLWIIYNTIYDSNNGIRQSYTGAGNENNTAFFIGNLIYDIHPEGAHNPEHLYKGGQGINLWQGGMKRYILDNTIHDTHGGISLGQAGETYISGNIISGILPPDYHISLFNALPKDTYIENMLFFDETGLDLRIRWKPSKYYALTAFQSASGKCTNCRFLNPLFTDVKTKNFNPKHRSPVIDANKVNPNFPIDPYALYEQLYGVSIKFDKNTNPRTMGLHKDIGAFERPPTPIKPPTSLRIVPIRHM